MGLFGANEFNNLNDLFLHQLEDLYDAETRLTKALPQMSQAASSPALKTAFDTHLRETEQQIKRLEGVFERLGKKAQRETCPAMKGLIAEGQEMISAKGDPAVRDAALIASAQRVEHYEIAGYGTLRTLANQLGMSDIAQTLQTTLDEEGATDKKLTALAEGMVNPKAANA